MLATNKERKTDYIDKKNYDSDPRKFLRIGNVYLYNEENKEIYMPAPLDLYLTERGRFEFGKIKKIADNIKTSSEDVTHTIIPSTLKDCKRAENLFVIRSNFYNSYFETYDSIGHIENSDIVSNSYKVGIERNDKYVSKEGHLYRIDLTEFKDEKWSYLLEYEIDSSWGEKGNESKDKSKEGFLKLGGENKVCKFYKYDIINKLSNYEKKYDFENKNEYVKMILLSPSIFRKNGSKPEFIDNNIKVIAASTGKPYRIGGFDMMLKVQKPMKNAVPEGSVYILKSEIFKGKKISEIKEIISNENIVEESYEKQGFGQFEIVPLFDEQIED